MADFMKLTSQVEKRLGHYATRLFRIEAHVRQGEVRAARKRLEGLSEELEQFEEDMEFPIEMTVIGAQVGFFSGKGSILRGRLPGALFGAVAGWLYGQSTACRYGEALRELKVRVRILEESLFPEETASEQPADQSPETDTSSESEKTEQAAAPN